MGTLYSSLEALGQVQHTHGELPTLGCFASQSPAQRGWRHRPRLAWRELGISARAQSSGLRVLCILCSGGDFGKNIKRFYNYYDTS